jgi:hypothetical protein
MKTYVIYSAAVLLLLLPVISFCQDHINTDVFTLSTSDPNGLSITKLTNGNARQVVTKLEVATNRPSVFQITGINPLRYKYFLNNEAVTQFMDNSALTFSINTFVNSDFLNVAPEIRIPEIFKTDSISSKVKLRMQDFQKRINATNDSLAKIDAEISRIWSDVQSSNQESIRDSASAKRSQFKSYSDFFAPDRNKKLFARQAILEAFKGKILKEYQTFTSGLPLNNPRFSILEQYKAMSLGSDSAICEIKYLQQQFAFDYADHHERFIQIEKILSELERDPYYLENDQDKRSKFMDLLKEYNFTWFENRFTPYDIYQSNYGSNDSRYGENITSVRQQILDKRFQLYEEFVLNIITKIGVLVQNQFRDYSSFNNILENSNSIPDSLQLIIFNRKKNLSSTFSFIQQTSAELQIMVSYLDVNSELYQNIAKKINSNYLFLLAYLKNLEFIIKNSTVQYTLPTHSNLKNIDVIRYTVTRDDKVTKGKQTYNYDFWLKGGMKVDFSVALVATRLTDNTYNKILLGNRNEIDSIRILRQDDGRADFAFGGMVNLTPRNGARWLNLGGSIGVAYSTNQRLQFLASASMHFGKTERIIAHFGLAFGRTNHLDLSSSNFKFYKPNSGLPAKVEEVSRENIFKEKENDRIYVIASPDVKYSSYTVPTFEKFVVRPFVGISYNLSKKNALQAVSGEGASAYNTNFKNISDK